MELLDKINTPDDLKSLSEEQLVTLCREVRDYMIDCCSRNPGHLGASLGAVEIIVGLHSVMNAPKDKIIFDVGHQAYAHKILTGRREAFATNRREGGISGFPKMSESPFDAFGVGHSSTSISAALGYAEAARIKGTDEKIVAVIGDGALTGGMAFEGLNNAGDSEADLLVILNDNNQSIDRNLGALHKHLLHITTNKTYNKVKNHIWDTLGEGRARSGIQRWIRGWKSYIVKKSGGDLFESLGFRYFGPIDGNDIAKVKETLRSIYPMHGPRVLHCITKKGKGYTPAEADPAVWHAPGRFNVETGERIVSPHPADRYQDVFGEVLTELARRDGRIVGITPAMASGCGMNIFAKEFPERFFDVGIEEEHAVTFSAGLAAGGLKPVCNIYSSFAQRAYDQIIHDVALQKLPVVICLDRAGVVGEDGPTHHGAFDLAAFRSIPGLTVAAPKDETELKNMMYTALEENDGPFIIRYPRGMGEGVNWREAAFESVRPGKAEKLHEGADIAVLALGHCANRALEAARVLEEDRGLHVCVYNMRYIKPLDVEAVAEAAACGRIVTVEDGSIKGGLFGAITECLAAKRAQAYVVPLGIVDEFVGQGTQSAQRTKYGMDVQGIVNTILECLEFSEKKKKDL